MVPSKQFYSQTHHSTPHSVHSLPQSRDFIRDNKDFYYREKDRDTHTRREHFRDHRGPTRYIHRSRKYTLIRISGETIYKNIFLRFRAKLNQFVCDFLVEYDDSDYDIRYEYRDRERELYELERNRERELERER